MCDRKAVHWAHESAKMAGPPVSLEDQHAMDAAHAWLKNPTEQTKAAAAAAALKAGHAGPGAWAAQAAALASHGGGAKAAAVNLRGNLSGAAAGAAKKTAAQELTAKAPGGGSLAGLAVAGAVGLAAAMKAGVKLPKPGAAAPMLPQKPAIPPPQLSAEALAKKTAEAHRPFVELGQKIAADPSIKC
jgi:hypothetical protein